MRRRKARLTRPPLSTASRVYGPLAGKSSGGGAIRAVLFGFALYHVAHDASCQ